jgi:hypothetical protein
MSDLRPETIRFDHLLERIRIETVRQIQAQVKRCYGPWATREGFDSNISLFPHPGKYDTHRNHMSG